MSVVGAADGSIIATVIVSQMPANQPNDPRSVPGPASMPRICSTATAHATSAAASTGVRTAVVWRATRDRLVVCTRSRVSPAGPPRQPRLPYDGAQILRHDLRLPDERPRLRADQGHARGARARRGADAPTRPTSSSSTRARSARSRTRSSPRTSATRRRASASDPDRVIAVGGCYAEAQRERIFELYPAVDVAFGPGSIAHLGEWLGAGGHGRRPRALRPRRPRLRRRAAAAPRALVPGVGAGLDGLQLEVLVLHRPGRARPRAEPRDPARSSPRCRRLAGQGVQGADAARPERQLVGPRPAARHPTPSSASCSAPATRSRASSASASRARTRRTSASR